MNWLIKFISVLNGILIVTLLSRHFICIKREDRKEIFNSKDNIEAPRESQIERGESERERERERLQGVID